jgi:hypothetical protein
MSHVIDVSRLNIIDQPSVVGLTMLKNSLTEVSLVLGVVKARLKLLIHCDTSVLSERLSKNVLRLDVWYEALISWNVLSFDVLGGPTNPVLTLL